MEAKIKQKRITGHFNFTDGEKLLIWRKRKELTQEEAARKLKVTYFSYKMAESDRHSLEQYKYPIVDRKLSTIEKCLLYRKRAKLTQKALADQIGICRHWLRMQETGEVSPDKLLAWWEK